MSKEILKNNSDFIFIYEAKQTNPNGDPDMENKPRMDYDTKTNLVTKYREKRTIRDYLKLSGKKIFVDTVEENKVSVESRVKVIIEEFFKNDNLAKTILLQNDVWKNNIETFKISVEDKTIKEIYDEFDKKEKEKEKDKKDKINMDIIRDELLAEIIKNELIDIRMFGGAFAVKGFTRTYTGAVQINWGYSMHPVQLMKSNSLVTIMNDGDSMFGKTHNVEYSLIAFNGTISKNMAKKTGMTVDDKEIFREAVINSLVSNPTSSKGNQYPIAYVEIEYDDNFNGFLYDMRNLIDVNFKEIVRNIEDIELKVDRIVKMIEEHKDIIKNIYYWESPFLNKNKKVFSNIFESETINKEIKGKIKCAINKVR